MVHFAAVCTVQNMALIGSGLGLRQKLFFKWSRVKQGSAHNGQKGVGHTSEGNVTVLAVPGAHFVVV